MAKVWDTEADEVKVVVWVEAVEPGKDPAASACAPSAGCASPIPGERLASSMPVRSAEPRWLAREYFFVREDNKPKKEKTCQVEIELDLSARDR